MSTNHKVCRKRKHPSPPQQQEEATESKKNSTTQKQKDLPTKRRKRVLVPIANGSEEIETACITDTLSRFGAEVIVASVGGNERKKKGVCGGGGEEEDRKCVMSRGMKILADTTIEEASKQTWDLIALPGGLIGAQHFSTSTTLLSLLQTHSSLSRPYGAVCASPSLVLAPAGLLSKQGGDTCYPHSKLRSKLIKPVNHSVVVQGNVITSQGPGTSLLFALQLGELLYGREKADCVAKKMLVLRRESVVVVEPPSSSSFSGCCSSDSSSSSCGCSEGEEERKNGLLVQEEERGECRYFGRRKMTARKTAARGPINLCSDSGENSDDDNDDNDDKLDSTEKEEIHRNGEENTKENNTAMETYGDKEKIERQTLSPKQNGVKEIASSSPDTKIKKSDTKKSRQKEKNQASSTSLTPRRNMRTSTLNSTKATMAISSYSSSEPSSPSLLPRRNMRTSTLNSTKATLAVSSYSSSATRRTSPSKPTATPNKIKNSPSNSTTTTPRTTKKSPKRRTSKTTTPKTTKKTPSNHTTTTTPTPKSTQKLKNHIFQTIIVPLLTQKLKWKVQKSPRTDRNDTYYFPPGTESKKGFKLRIDYFDSQKQVLSYLDRHKGENEVLEECWFIYNKGLEYMEGEMESMESIGEYWVEFVVDVVKQRWSLEKEEKRKGCIDGENMVGERGIAMEENGDYDEELKKQPLNEMDNHGVDMIRDGDGNDDDGDGWEEREISVNEKKAHNENGA